MMKNIWSGSGRIGNPSFRRNSSSSIASTSRVKISFHFDHHVFWSKLAGAVFVYSPNFCDTTLTTRNSINSSWRRLFRQPGQYLRLLLLPRWCSPDELQEIVVGGRRACASSTEVPGQSRERRGCEVRCRICPYATISNVANLSTTIGKASLVQLPSFAQNLHRCFNNALPEFAFFSTTTASASFRAHHYIINCLFRLSLSCSIDTTATWVLLKPLYRSLI